VRCLRLRYGFVVTFVSLLYRLCRGAVALLAQCPKVVWIEEQVRPQLCGSDVVNLWCLLALAP
jgi:hypothetical protein